MKGTIKWYNPLKGFGFIEVENEKDVFVHRTSVPQGTKLDEGDEVEFEVKKTDKGLEAVDIIKL